MRSFVESERLSMPANKRALLFTALAGLVFTAMFMPWTAFVVEEKFSMDSGGRHVEVRRPVISEARSAWTGTTTVMWIACPQWGVFVAALALAAIAWLETCGALANTAFISLILAGYGLVYSGGHCVAAVADEHSRIGLGALLTVVAFLIYAWLMIGSRSWLSAAFFFFPR